MNLEECRRILRVPPDAGPEEVKTAFRRLAFRLHPDLNPAPDAAERFRELDEAYVVLSHSVRAEAQARKFTRGAGTGRKFAAEDTAETARARRAKAERAYAANAAGARSERPTDETFHCSEEEVLRDLLSDPFARQVFEDIYRQLRQRPSAGGRSAAGPMREETSRMETPQTAPPQRAGGGETWPVRPRKRRRLTLAWGKRTFNLDLSRGLVGGIKSWLRGQLDDEETVSFPAFALGPGRTVRLSIRSRFDAVRTIEVTLPTDFAIGRPMRLRGLGRRLGPFTGDLFLRVLAK